MGGGGQSGHGHYIVFLYTGYPGTGHLDPPTSLGLATPLPTPKVNSFLYQIVFVMLY